MCLFFGGRDLKYESFSCGVVIFVEIVWWKVFVLLRIVNNFSGDCFMMIDM